MKVFLSSPPNWSRVKTALESAHKRSVMKKLIIGLALASVIPALHSQGFADSVISYNPGVGFAIDGGTGLGFTNSLSALGEPSRVTPGQFGGPVDQFNPPYLREQVVSIGTGGSLTVHFDPPVLNSAEHPFGLDFLLFGNSGFIIVNGDFTGGGITDGSLFAANEGGETRVSISSDGLTYYTLDPSLTPLVDSLFPTDGSGDFHLPVNPLLNSSTFNGKGLADFRALYNGSAGGTGFDISWARNSQGQPVFLDSIQFVRVDVLRGASEIDGFAIVPEPSTWIVLLLGLGILTLRRRV
jgi:hypothetical protein